MNKNQIRLEKYLGEKNIERNLLEAITETILMMVFGTIVVIKTNFFINMILRWLAGFSDTVYQWIDQYMKQVNPEASMDTIMENGGTVVAGATGMVVKHIFHFSVVKIALYFWIITVLTLIAYMMMLWICSKAYADGNKDIRTILGVLAYRGKRMMIPMIIGVILSLILVIAGVIALLVSSIIGCVSIYEALQYLHPNNKKNIGFTILTVFICGIIRIVLYISCFVLVLPSALTFIF